MTFNPGLISIILGILVRFSNCLIWRFSFCCTFSPWFHVLGEYLHVQNVMQFSFEYNFKYFNLYIQFLYYTNIYACIFYIYYIPIDFFISSIIFKVYFTIPLVVIYDLGYFYERNSMVLLNSPYLCSLISFYILFHYYIM